MRDGDGADSRPRHFPETGFHRHCGDVGIHRMPALLEAFDSSGNVVDRKSLDSVPGRKAPGRSGPGLYDDREREADRVRRVFRPAGRRISRGGRSSLHAGRRPSVTRIEIAGHFAFAATSKSPCV